ncbi:MAG: thioesterase family protein [Planctomycetota bacterium]
MTEPNEGLPPILREYEFDLRVRYRETDGQGRVHHSNYLNYFEIARVEMLRASGRNYKDVEASGILMVVTHATCRYFYPAAYDDLLRIRVELVKTKKTRAIFAYHISLDEVLVAEGETTIAAVSQEGKIVRLPDWML